MSKNTSKIGIIGLAVMGSNLARNFVDKKISVSVYNRTTDKTDQFLKEFDNELLTGSKTLKEFISSLEKPRKVLLMVKSGPAIDEVIKEILPLLSKDDIIVDLGNSNFHDTERRYNELTKHEIQFVGCGISGGEEGALHGPSLMPGCSKTAWKELQPYLEAVSALDFHGKPCVSHIGPTGSGHYIKMVHNGIEYAIMQTIAEAYEILKLLFDMPAPQIGRIFHQFNQSKLNSYLYELSSKVLQKHDEKGSGYLIDKILDKASQKGTGMWTVIDAMERSVAVPTIAASVMSRIISGDKEKRSEISGIYKKRLVRENLNLDEFVQMLDDALFSAMICSYAQGIELIQKASKENKWNINTPEVVRIWQGGCIIRAGLLKSLEHCFREEAKHPETHVFELPESRSNLKGNISNLRNVVEISSKNQIPVPALASSLSYFDGMTQKISSANMIQALRDAFGAHTYERNDVKGTYHTEWD